MFGLRNSILISVLLATSVSAQTIPENMVHPLVGTQNEGQTYPAVGVPFAMTHWTPQTRAGENEVHCAILLHRFKDSGLRGSHFLSGSCVPDYGSMTIMPGVGELKTGAVSRASSFARQSEHASPYSYEIDLRDAHTRATITGSLRSGVMKFEFTEDAKDAWVVVENNARGGDGWVEVNPVRMEVVGQVPVRREYAGSGQLAGFSGYFVMQFDHKVARSGTWIGDQAEDNKT